VLISAPRPVSADVAPAPVPATAAAARPFGPELPDHHHGGYHNYHGGGGRSGGNFHIDGNNNNWTPRVYADGPGSAHDVDTYYAAAQGKTGAALISSLHDIITHDHVDRGYNTARDEMFGPLDDPSGNGEVADLYSGDEFQHVTDRKTAYSAGLNTEHTWPQSLGARGIAQDDLHQLQPANIETNGRRGNFGYGEVVKQLWDNGESGDARSILGLDASGTEVFEPRPGVRGDIARGLLYFYTRYNTDRPADYDLAEFRHELPTLVQWSHDDPVDDVERARNQAIDAFQGNRNPFVDHPEWVDAAGFATLQP
jgi:endonuclease I